MPRLNNGMRFDRFSTMAEAKVFAALFTELSPENHVQTRTLDLNERVMLDTNGLPRLNSRMGIFVSDCTAGIFYKGEESLIPKACDLLSDIHLPVIKLAERMIKRLQEIINGGVYPVEELRTIFIAMGWKIDPDHKIPLIKRVRDATGAGLRECKETVDAVLEEYF